MDETVKNFYTKNAETGYLDQYAKDHIARHQFMVDKYNLNAIENKEVAEFGAGLGIMFSLLKPNNKFYGFDGATIPEHKKLSTFISETLDLDEQHDKKYQSYYSQKYHRKFDVSLMCEVIEHVASPFRALNNLKWFTKDGGDVYITIPDERMTHPVIYYQLFYPHTNFIDFLECMALPVKEAHLFNGNWPSWTFKCENRPWREKKMHFYKGEEKFRNANLLETTNL